LNGSRELQEGHAVKNDNNRPHDDLVSLDGLAAERDASIDEINTSIRAGTLPRPIELDRFNGSPLWSRRELVNCDLAARRREVGPKRRRRELEGQTSFPFMKSS
jgi:hypothetical protein